MPVKPLSFKGDKKLSSKKRKHTHPDPTSSNTALTTTTTTTTTSHNSTTEATTEEDDDTTWSPPSHPSELTGPTLLILPTNPPTCLASDANGRVFASQLENIIDGRPETGEPDDVRQVWVATQLDYNNTTSSKTKDGEGGDARVGGRSRVSFKGSHGGFLGVDDRGGLQAGKVARGEGEGWVVETVEDNTEGDGKVRWCVRSAVAEGEEGGCLSAVVEGGAEQNGDATAHNDDDGHDEDDDDAPRKRKVVKIRLSADANKTSPQAQLILKMQSRFKRAVQQEKETKASQKVSRAELEKTVGRKLEDEEVRRLKRARREGRYYEEVLDVRVKGKHDKFA